MALITRNAVSGGDRRWLASEHGFNDAKTFTLTATDFTGDAVNGVIPSGTAVTITDGDLAAYDGATLSGFLLEDVRVTGEDTVNVAVILHATIDGALLPKQIAEPTNAAGFTFTNENWSV